MKERKIEMMKYNLDWVKTNLKKKEKGKNKLKVEKLDGKSWNMTKIYKISKNKAADNIGAIIDDFYEHELRRSSVKTYNNSQNSSNYAKKSKFYDKKAKMSKKQFKLKKIIPDSLKRKQELHRVPEENLVVGLRQDLRIFWPINLKNNKFEINEDENSVILEVMDQNSHEISNKDGCYKNDSMTQDEDGEKIVESGRINIRNFEE